MSFLEQMYVLAKGQNLHLSGHSMQSYRFFVERTLKDGGKIRFKVRYRADLESFGMLKIFLINAQTGTAIASMSIASISVQSEERERELNIWEVGNYYFLFKMSAGSGSFDISNYQLYWSIH